MYMYFKIIRQIQSEMWIAITVYCGFMEACITGGYVRPARKWVAKSQGE